MAHSATNAPSAAFGALRGADDTIAAIATPAGRGAIALVRMSGSRADAIAARVVMPWPTAARVATLCAVRDPVEQTLVDRALVTRFEHGASFTGEQSVEISTHGGHVTPTLVLAALLAAGARQALPGEFTRRALINGTLDLAQAEAIGDVIDATSRVAHRAALDILDGGLSRRVLALRDALLEVEALIAYEIDFPEEDDGPIAPERIRNATTRAYAAIEALVSTAPAGELVRNGALVVIAGPPNAGKSSLFNALLGDARALVTPVPGTTRDAIEAVVDGRRWPLRLVDTAGLRESTDMLEQLGIEVSERYLRRAEAILACGERREDIEATVERVSAIASAPVIRVLTKADDASPDEARASNAVSTSAETGIGLTALLAAVEDAISIRHGAPSLDAPVLTRARHVAALRQAGEEIGNFMSTWSAGTLPPTVAAVHLRAAVAALEELVGAVDIEDVLERVFRTFCVGK